VRTLITGATGFIGSHVARAALAAGEKVRVLIRRESSRTNIEGLPVEVATGNLTDHRSLEKAMRGCRRVYHVAALYSFSIRDPQRFHAVNVEGSRAVFDAAGQAGVERIVYTSSVAALAHPEAGRVVTEATPVDPSRIIGAYKQSKYRAEQVALEFAERGVPVVIVNPSFPVGPWDGKPTPTGQVIVDFLNRNMPAYVRTGMNLVDVEDVAQGHLLAAERGVIGERYILGGRNVTMKELLGMLSEITGLAAPRFCIPHAVVAAAAYANVALCRVTGGAPRMTPDTARMARDPMYYDPAKAVGELGLPQSDPREALAKAVAWYLERGYVQRGPLRR